MGIGMARHLPPRMMATVGAAVILAAVLTHPATASAWGGDKSSNGFVLNRESTDTTVGVNVYLYWDYMGGSNWDPNYPIADVSRFRQSATVAWLDSFGEGCEIPLRPGYRVQMVRVYGGGVDRRFGVISEPLSVDVTRSCDVTVSAVEGTLTADAGESTMEYFGWLFGIVCIGVFFVAGSRAVG